MRYGATMMNFDERKFDPDQSRDASGLIFKDYDGNVPAAAPVVTGDPALDQALSVYTDTIGEFVGEQCGQNRHEVQAAGAPLQGASGPLKLQPPQLARRGAVLRA